MNKLDLEQDINNGLSGHQIAKKYKLGQTTIRYWLKKFQLQTKARQFGKGYEPLKIYENLDWNECQKLYDSGLSWGELKEYGFSNNGIYWAVKNKRLKMRKSGETNKIKHKLGKIDYSIYRTKEFRKKQSKFGGYKENSGRCKHLSYSKKDGTLVKIQGSWELKFVRFLDEKNINWERNKLGYKYIFENKEHIYFPDFLLTDNETYIEVKGYQTSKDNAKWNQFPKKLLIVKKKEIENLNSWFETLTI